MEAKEARKDEFLTETSLGERPKTKNDLRDEEFAILCS
eukprot:CAMPEP_0185782204 /NCGR_PEP_ID=MMETSP1174-20130828/107275_1 /TAXON_ID=35687 /ORGANISM="Dictyocha speculum, Strain CCMP1381" /LENGTH=37 /DNA_ID= /DNA_START= /DNA_END= /DNA_ORIENTATION=